MIGKRAKVIEGIKKYLFIITLIGKMEKKFFFFTLPFIVFKTMYPIVMMVFSKMLIDKLLEGGDFKKIIVVLILFAIVFLINKVGLIYTESKVAYYIEIIEQMLNGYINNNVINMQYEHLEDPDVRNLIQRVNSNSKASMDTIMSVLNLFVAVIQSLAIIGIISKVHIGIVIVLVFVIVVKIWAESRSNKKWMQCREEATPSERKGLYISNFATEHSGAKEVRINNLKGWLIDLSNECNRKNISIYRKYFKAATKYQTIVFFISSVQIFITYIILIAGVLVNQLTIGDFSMYLIAINTLSDSLRKITSLFDECRRNYQYNNELTQLIDIGKNNRLEKITENTNEKIDIKDISICFENVYFKYPKSSKYILKNINLEIKSKEKLSIVGINGAGKTTLIKLLCRLYKPTQGRILINNIDIQQIPYDIYNMLIGAVFQDFKLFSFSLKENIILDQLFEEDKFLSSVDKSSLSERCKKLVEGYETNLYKDFDDNGIEFSGGEMQKIAIARAIYKNAPIIILDEPTASLDALSEFQIYDRFNELSADKTTIFISHRLSSTRFSDKIVVLNEGEIVEYGNHSELLKQSGIYSRMFKSQANQYL